MAFVVHCGTLLCVLHPENKRPNITGKSEICMYLIAIIIVPFIRYKGL